MQIHCLPNFDRRASGSDKRHFPAGGGGSQWGLIGESGNQVGGCVKTDKSKLYKHLEEQVHEFISLLENVASLSTVIECSMFRSLRTHF